jgi:hypothetical protein
MKPPEHAHYKEYAYKRSTGHPGSPQTAHTLQCARIDPMYCICLQDCPGTALTAALEHLALAPRYAGYAVSLPIQRRCDCCLRVDAVRGVDGEADILPRDSAHAQRGERHRTERSPRCCFKHQQSHNTVLA